MQIPNLADAEDATQAQVDSRDFSDILAPAFSYTGVLSGCAVAAQGTPNMTVAVSAGVVVVNGTVVTVGAGNVTISANASGNARFDLICVDAAGVKSAVAGTPSASPVFPNPAGKVVLAAVRVPTGVASISNAKLVDKRIFNTLSSLAFGAAGDTNLYRSGANALKTDGSFTAAGGFISSSPLTVIGSVGNATLQSYVGGDSQLRFYANVAGQLWWGTGAVAQDTNLYRSAANQLTTSGGFIAGAGKILLHTDGGIYFGAAQDTVLYRSADVAPGLVLNGTFLAGSWGQFSNGVNQVTVGDISLVAGGAARPGIVFGNALDTNLYRGQVNTLQTTGSLFFKGGAGTYPIAVYANLTDGNSRFYISGDTGQLNWGPGNSGADASIYRSNPGMISVHTDLWVEGNAWPQGNMQAASSVSAYQGNAFWQTQIGYDAVMPGPGISFSAAKDTNLYRLSAGALQTDGSFYAKGQVYAQPAGTGTGFVYYAGAPGGAAFYSAISGEANARFRFNSDGFMAWGPGGSTGTDTTLYRTQTGILATDGQIYLRSASSYLAFYQVADAAARFYIGPTGNLNWGPGTATQDTNLYRAAAGLLMTDSIFVSTKDIIANRLTSNQIWLNADGAIYFGSASDTRIYRNGANSLQTDGSLYVGGSFEAVGGRIGVIGKSITDWNNALDNGWYMGAGALNAPGGLTNWFIGEVQAHGATGWRIQRISDFTATADSQVWERRQMNGVWSAWVKSGFYNAGATAIKTDYEVQVGGQLWANVGLANQFVFANDGKMYFGSATDTNLYRGGANSLKTDGSFLAAGRIVSQGDIGFMYNPANTTGYLLGSIIQGEANWRLLVARDGRMDWGPGGAVATDTALYRSSVGQISTSGGFTAEGLVIANNSSALRIIMHTDGRLYFGSAFDTNLYRMQANVLISDGGLYLKGTSVGIGYVFNPATAAGNALATLASGDAAYRYVADVNGRMSWGPGNVAGDTFLYRGGAGMLRTDGQFITGGNVWVNKAVADSQPQILLSRDLVGVGKPGIMFGPGGTTAPDVNLYRDAVGALATDSTLRFNGGSASKQIFQVFGSGDTVPRFLARVDGYMGWGPGGSTGIDVSLFRLTPTDLKTDGNFYVHKSFIVDHQGGAAPLYFGASFDTSIWRNAAARLTTNSHITISADAHTVEFSSIQAGAPSGGSAGGAVGGIVVWVDGVQRTIAFYNP